GDWGPWRCSIGDMRRPWLLSVIALGLAPIACSRSAHERTPAPSDTATTNAILRDRPPTLVVPLGGARVGSLTFSSVALKRDDLASTPTEVAPDAGLGALPPPTAEPGEPPASSSSTASSSSDDSRSLKPPIPRGTPELVSGGAGGRVTLDVRVDEQGEVSDALFVESDADSLTVSAATEAALRLRF